MKRTQAASRTLPDFRLSWIAFAAAAALALVLTACGAGPQGTPGEPAATPIDIDPPVFNDITVGKEASSITIVTAEDVREAVEGAEGRVALVNFWATWCPPCVAELPYFAKVYEEYDRATLHFLSFSADHPDTIERSVEPFLEERDLPFPILLMDAMPDDIEGVLGESFPGNLPVTLLYDADGTVAQRWDREVSFEELQEAIDALLS